MSILSILLSGCGFGEVCFSNIELGKNFAGSPVMDISKSFRITTA